MKVSDMIYDSWANLTGIILEENFAIDEKPWIGMKWDFFVLYTDGDLAGAMRKDLEVINESN
ncbi:MAG TPA: hypothetical protein EYQ00_12135 [Dehalococcoidia bacterium]|jgi:hypothetical protein|nr:hypothetical protein [Dehalococcoidia bacterium]